MNKEFNKKLILGFGSVVIIMMTWAFMRFIFPITAPFIIAFIIAAVLNPVVTKLSVHFKNNKMIASGIIVAIIAAIIFFVISILGYVLIKEIIGLSQNYEYYWQCGCRDAKEFCTGVDEAFGLYKGESFRFICNCKDAFTKNVQNSGIFKTLETTFLMLSKGMVGAGLLIAGAVVMFISVIFISRDYEKIKASARKSIFRTEIKIMKNAMVRLLNVYFKTQFIIICCTSTICTVALLILKNPYCLVIGIGIGLLDALPLFGTGTVLIPWIIVSFVRKKVFQGVALMIVFLITYLLRQFLESKLIGDKLNITPVFMLLSIYVGMLLLGFWGFVLGPVSYCLIVTGIQLLKSNIESGNINSI